jgi:ribosomal protein S18 acetylase RimI-like enzyme
MPRLRRFRNDDPPRIAEIWNDALTGRGTFPLTSLGFYERCVLSKPYFDPGGLLIAEEGGQAVGFVHAGFGPTGDEAKVDSTGGVVSAIAVKRTHQRHGVGTQLLAAAETYLRERGTCAAQAGPRWPRCPFYFGLYGGSGMPGFLDSDQAAAPFLRHGCFNESGETAVLQRPLDAPFPPADPRFSALRRRFEIRLLPQLSIGSWWQECVYGLVEPVEFRLEEKTNGMPAARAVLWEMEGYSGRWGRPAAGLIDVQVRAEMRRQGLARILLTQIMRRLQEEYFGIVETQVTTGNLPAFALFAALGFERVDTGRVFEKQLSQPLTDRPR